MNTSSQSAEPTTDLTPASLRGAWSDLEGYMNAEIIGKKPTIEALMVALLSGEHVLYIGPPGTAKSLMARKLSECIQADDAPAKVREIQFARDTTSEQCFGPLDLKKLVPEGDAASRYVRLQGSARTVYAPEAHVLIMDEPANASSGVLQAFHALLQERRFDTGEQWVDCPLQVCIGTSNEPLPADCYALADRFALRHREDYLTPSNGSRLFRLMVSGGLGSNVPKPTLTLAQIAASRVQAKALPWDEATLAARDKLDADLRANNITVSDRTWGKLVNICQAYAWLRGADAVRTSHLYIARHVLWTRLADADLVSDLVEDVVGKEAKEIRALLGMARQDSSNADTQALFDRSLDPETRQQAIQNCGELLANIAGYGRSLRDGYADAGPVYDEAVSEVRQMASDLMAQLERAGCTTAVIQNYLKGNA